MNEFKPGDIIVHTQEALERLPQRKWRNQNHFMIVLEQFQGKVRALVLTNFHNESTWQQYDYDPSDLKELGHVDLDHLYSLSMYPGTPIGWCEDYPHDAELLKPYFTLPQQ